MGQLDLNGSLGRLYGGIGIAIDQPELEVVAEKSESFSVICEKCDEERLGRISCEYLTYYELPGVRIELTRSLPIHSGLGSGTSLSLALGFAITRIHRLHPPIAELAAITDREGSRSGLGVAAFERGGFLVDGGKSIDSVFSHPRFQIPPLLARIPFPDDWVIILALPEGERMFGRKEEDAFRSLPPMDQKVSGAICRLLLMQLLPSLVERNLESFGRAIEAVQELVGSYFAPIQGGTFASPAASRIVEYMRSQGISGVGQSSWGPSIYGFAHKGSYLDIVENIRNYIGDFGQVWATSGRNHGASWGWLPDNKSRVSSALIGGDGCCGEVLR